MLGAALAGWGGVDRASYCGAWNFGPSPTNAQPVRCVVEEAVKAWGSGTWEDQHDPNAPHESRVLRLAIDKAITRLGWRPHWDLATTIRHTVAWYRAAVGGADASQLRHLMSDQIRLYAAAAEQAH